jgi:tetratricopeptide (TPR) repeat protein
MDRIRQLIHEAHRRSIWQVLSVYLVGSWVALQVVESISESAGLPDWAPPFALILLIIGLPVVLATAVVQEGLSGREEREEEAPSGAKEVASAGSPHSTTPLTADGTGGDNSAGIAASTAGRAGSDAEGRESSTGVSGAHRLLTWRNAFVGGVAAFALLGVLLTGYFISWSTGIGPVGSLAAQGVFSQGDAVVLAQFENTSDDESLGNMVTEALRVDLAGSSIMTLVEPNRIQDALRRMGRDAEENLDATLAREVAIRDGFKAVIHGTVGSAGSGYIFVASLVAADPQTVLATFRETARGQDDVIDAIDKLSQDIREKAGESLRVIKGEEPLEDVTTSSLDALRKYAESDRLSEMAEYSRAIAALEEAIDLDPSFAMAYRKLAVLLQNSGGSVADQIEATTRAYELRDRLTERERYLADAYYHNLVTLDLDAEIQAYETVLERFPDDQAALNNIALALLERTRLDEALAALERAVNGPGASAPAYTNYPGYLAMAGRHEEAERALAALDARYPGRGLWMAWNRVVLAAYRGDAAATRDAGGALLDLPETQGGWKNAGYLALIIGEALGGSLQAAHTHARRNAEELRSIGLEDVALTADLGSIMVELIMGRKAEAMRAYSRLDLETALASIPAPARNYEMLVAALARLGLHEEVEAALSRWKADDIPSSNGPRFDQARRDAEAALAGLADPGLGLSELNDLSRDLNCPRCAIWDRAVFAQEVGRLTDARDLFLAATEGGSGDYLLEPILRLMAHERLGQVNEALGAKEEAARHYAIFAEAWAGADDALQSRVQAAREYATMLGVS